MTAAMKHLAAIVAFVSLAQAHYVFPALISGGVTTADWKNVR